MKIIVTESGGDWKVGLYQTSHVEYEVVSEKLKDFLSELKEKYDEDPENEELGEYADIVSTLHGEGWLDTGDEEDFEDTDEIEEDTKYISTEYEYEVDEESISKEEYDKAWDELLGRDGSSHWITTYSGIKNKDTGETIYEYCGD